MVKKLRRTKRVKSKKRRRRTKMKRGGVKKQTVSSLCKQVNKPVHADHFSDDESDDKDQSIESKIENEPFKPDGIGYFSEVFFCQANPYAIKLSPFTKWDGFYDEGRERFIKQMRRESTIQKELAKNDISLKIVTDGSINEDNELFYYIIMERADGDLRHFINAAAKSKVPIDIPSIRDKILILYEKMHKMGYLHNDIRAGNIVYKLPKGNDLNKAKFYIIDLGFTAPFTLPIDEKALNNEQEELEKTVLTPLVEYLEGKKETDIKKVYLEN